MATSATSRRRGCALGTEAPAVDRLNLHIEDGEFVVLVGPSGSGKTTACACSPASRRSAGAILIGTRDVTDLAPKRRDVAMVFQNYALYPYLTVEQNIAFPLRIAKVKKSERSRASTTSPGSWTTEYLQRKAGQLSGGQRQRVAIGRAIVREPSVFLMDEPLQNSTRSCASSARRSSRRCKPGSAHDRLRHARPVRGDDPRPPRGAAPGREATADRIAAGAPRPPREHVRGRLHRLTRDEPLRASVRGERLDSVRRRDRAAAGRGGVRRLGSDRCSRLRPSRSSSRARGFPPGSR